MFPTSGNHRIHLMYRLACLVLIMTIVGCNRTHYRQQADAEVTAVITEKSYDDRWAIPCFNIDIDPRSRIYDPYDPDHEPMPPDDPDSHQFMHCIDGMKGYSRWHENGEIEEIENPFWRGALGEYTQITPEGAVKLNLEDSVKLAMIHSSRYQAPLETLYLTALDVSTERFRFDVQFFGGLDTTFDHQGQETSSGESNSLTLGRTSRSRPQTLEFRKRFATAGELLVGFANEIVWEFSGGDFNVTSSLLNFSIVQPLLRAGGRVIALEQLTIAERSLLANLRAYQHWKQGFYTQMAVGSSGNVPSPRRRGGFFGGTGLTGFTGQGSGGFGGVGSATGFGRGGGGGAGGGGGGVGTTGAGGGAGNVGGFIGLLQQSQQLRNREDNLNLQLRTLALLEESQQAGLIDVAQVLQFQQSIETKQADLLQARNSLQDSLDTFKAFNLGLPPDLQLELEDSVIKPFQFIDPRVTNIENEMAAFLIEFGELPPQPSLAQLQEAIRTVTAFRDRIPDLIEMVQRDLQILDEAVPARQRGMSSQERQQFLEKIRRFNDSLKQLQLEFNETAEMLRQLKAGLSPQTRELVANNLVALVRSISEIASGLSLTQARTRVESFQQIDPIQLTSQDALEIARANRFDWMNNRAALVDSWRLIEFNANALESNLDIFFEGDMGNLNDGNPFKFRSQNGNLRAGLRFDAPLTRLFERNNYRQQLINYQQARRQLIGFEDGVNRSLRSQLRVLEQLRLNLEIQRRAVGIAVDRVDIARETLNKPVPPPLPGQLPQTFGPTATRDLVDALDALRDAQNNFMSVWLNYYSERMQLVRDLGLMELDSHGSWIDRPLSEILAQACAEPVDLPPGVPQEWWQLDDPNGVHGAEEVPPQDSGPGAEALVLTPHEAREQEVLPPPSASEATSIDMRRLPPIKP
ncbi:MAG: TolC family protein, partial [Planctomycetes bacterium]|nr:TolC family protein [Planctomycetota bacterium]